MKSNRDRADRMVRCRSAADPAGKAARRWEFFRALHQMLARRDSYFRGPEGR
ncbi:hypothetical protein [Streptomyces sp. NPDC059918]|uniref:hypothetical protein n=1 Tax=unclassified Streptomyces TaxID=2593676 RepID=UPI003649F0B0